MATVNAVLLSYYIMGYTVILVKWGGALTHLMSLEHWPSSIFHAASAPASGHTHGHDFPSIRRHTTSQSPTAAGCWCKLWQAVSPPYYSHIEGISSLKVLRETTALLSQPKDLSFMAEYMTMRQYRPLRVLPQTYPHIPSLLSRTASTLSSP